MRRARTCAVVLSAVAITTAPAAAQVVRENSRHQASARAAGTLIFYSLRNPGGGLYTRSAAGGPLRELITGGDWLSAGVVWSPDGRRYLYERPGTPVWRPELWLSDANGRHRHLLAVDAAQAGWAPGGRRIVFVRNGAVWVVGWNGRGAHAVTKPERVLPGTYDSAPRWSPDGRSLAFLRAAPPGTTSESDLMLVATNGERLRRVARCTYWPPTWSPKGTRIAFDSCGPQGYDAAATGLYVANRLGKRLRLLDRDANGPPAWSPDGKWIAFDNPALGATSVIRPNGSGRRRLAPADYATAPAWAPDSRQLALAHGQPSDVWVVGLDGSSVQVTEGSRYGYSSSTPAWQPCNLPARRLGGRVVSPAIPTDSIVESGVLRATRPIQAIAADGGRVAIQYGPGPPSGGSIETWDAPAGSIVRFDEYGYQPPALAGGRVALPQFEHALGTNSYGIQIASVARPNPTWVTGLCPPTARTICIRDPLGDVVGRGSLLVFDSWKGPEPYCNERCPPPKRDGRLFRVDGGAAVQIAASSAELTPLAVDAGRILVNEGSGTLAVLDSNGATLLSLAVPGFTEASLQGSDLVVHAGDGLADYDAATGALLRRWPLPADARLEDLEAGVAVYVTSSDVHLLRLADGRERLVAPPGVGPLHAQLGAGGLFYSFAVADQKHPGRVAFEPNAALRPSVR